jgi:hypothetical protein
MQNMKVFVFIMVVFLAACQPANTETLKIPTSSTTPTPRPTATSTVPVPTVTPTLLAGYDTLEGFDYIYRTGVGYAVINSSGETFKQINADFQFLGWSREGKWLMFADLYGYYPGPAKLLLISVYDDELIELFDYPLFKIKTGISWHPSKNKFVANCLGEGPPPEHAPMGSDSFSWFQICEVDTETLEIHRFPFYGYQPEYLPDGSIVFAVPQNSIAGTSVIAWAFDGSVIEEPSNEWILYKIIDTQDQPTELTHIPFSFSDFSHVNSLIYDQIFSISSDPPNIFFSPSGGQGVTKMFRIDVYGGDVSLVRENVFEAACPNPPTFSPSLDGSYIIISYNDACRGGKEINALLNTSDGSYKESTPDIEAIYWWSPDGKHLYGQLYDIGQCTLAPCHVAYATPYEIDVKTGQQIESVLPESWSQIPEGEPVFRFFNRDLRPH